MKTLFRKLSITVVLLTVIVILVSAAGKRMIESSPVYQASCIELKKQYGVNPADLSIRLLAPFKFSEGDSAGVAEFVLCNLNGCYEVKAKKSGGLWQVSTAKK